MSPFPFTLSELQQKLIGLEPESYIVLEDAAFWLASARGEKQLGILASRQDSRLAQLQGEQVDFSSGFVLKRGAVNHANARALRKMVPWLVPDLIGTETSAGLGDRIGMATPGHVRAVRKVGGGIVPIFAQQSIREMQRTNRSPDDVMADATWGAFAAGWRGRLGADADHLKTPADIDACVQAGFSFYTFDPGDHVDSSADEATPAQIESKVSVLPWKNLETTRTDLERRFLGRSIDLESRRIDFDKAVVLRAAAKYGRAIAHIAMMFRHLAAKGIPYEVEVSVDETETPTTHAEHIFVTSELKRLGVRWVSLAPRYVGRFEKGSDYIGDVATFRQDFAVHAEIARAFGPYKLSIHTGSDKFSIYGITMDETRGLVHLKTAGTSYLEALRTIAPLDPTFFREIYVFARERFEIDRATYLLSAKLEHAPQPNLLKDEDLPALLTHFDAREILHVTFGSVLTAVDANGRLRFRNRLVELLNTHAKEYASNLESHFVKHLKPFAAKKES